MHMSIRGHCHREVPRATLEDIFSVSGIDVLGGLEGRIMSSEKKQNPVFNSRLTA